MGWLKANRRMKKGDEDEEEGSESHEEKINNFTNFIIPSQEKRKISPRREANNEFFIWAIFLSSHEDKNKVCTVREFITLLENEERRIMDHDSTLVFSLGVLNEAIMLLRKYEQDNKGKGTALAVPPTDSNKEKEVLKELGSGFGPVVYAPRDLDKGKGIFVEVAKELGSGFGAEELNAPRQVSSLDLAREELAAALSPELAAALGLARGGLVIGSQSTKLHQQQQDATATATGKRKPRWSPYRIKRFDEAVQFLNGINNATAKRVKNFMKDSELTLGQIQYSN